MSELKKIAVIGHFGFGEELGNGQTVKTKNFTNELKKRYGGDNVLEIDSSGGKLAAVKAPFQVLKALKKCKNVIIFPAHNGVRVYAPLLCFFRRFFKERKIHYSIVGGWLADFLSDKPRLEKKLKTFDGLYAETTGLKSKLEEKGFKNVYLVPNFKSLCPVDRSELIYTTEKPFRFCTFSRVMKEKGIEDAVAAVNSVNEICDKTICELDIYGQIENGEEEWFENLRKTFSEHIKYKGVVSYDKSVEVLKPYFALLFPTRFYTEGIPGTIIDAYAAGVPVISSEWENTADIIADGKTGYVFPMGDVEKFTEILRDICGDPDKINALKENALKRVNDFLPEAVLPAMENNLG